MARAKSTRRAEARRRYRSSRAAYVEPSAEDTAEVAEASATTAPADGRSRFGISPPDVRADLQAFPGIVRSRRFWIPVLLLIGGFLSYVGLASGTGGGVWPLGLVAQVALGGWPFGPTGQLLYIPPLTVFLAGYLAPRAAWLVGLVLAIVNAFLLVIAVAVIANSPMLAEMQRTVAEPNAPLARDVILAALNPGSVTWFLLQAAGWGIAVGGIAGWYKRFLQRSAERRRAMLIERARQKQAEERQRAAEERRRAVEERRQARTTRPATTGAGGTASAASPTSGGGKSGESTAQTRTQRGA